MSAVAIEIRAISPEDTIPLRHSVLWPNHPISHVVLPDDSEPATRHYGAFSPASPTRALAVISLFDAPLPVSDDDDDDDTPVACPAAQFRKFACDPAFQGRGIGTQLLLHVFGVAATEMGCGVIWCDARLSSVGWYERRGMKQFGETLFKSDIEYVRMKRELGGSEQGRRDDAEH